MKAIVCKVGSTPEVVELSENGETAFEQVRQHVGGYVERVRLGKFDVYVDEDGLPKGLPHNRTVAGQPIVGTFVVLGASPMWLVGLTDNEAKWLVTDLTAGGCLTQPVKKPGLRKCRPLD